ncbi:MAG TPA: FtsX-like permease family protein, partial [Bryobacteraceae bacterium]|nr:FtsX-like permease family protein [Bryobacteraceae bacterium]
FAALEVSPMMGRVLSAADDLPGVAPVVVLSHKLWRTEFGGDRSIIGKALIMDGVQRTVVGVMPSEFDFPRLNQFWIPIGLTEKDRRNRGGHYLSVLGRLAPGRTRAEAQAEMDRIAQVLAKDHPPSNQGVGVALKPLLDYTVEGSKRVLVILFGAVGFVLLIACANVANLLLSRAESRRKEMAVRIALGASARHIVRQLVAEGLVLTFAGGILGGVGARWALDVLVKLPGFDIPRTQEIGLDGRVLAFTVLLMLLTGIVFGLAPVAQILSRNTHDALSEDARSGGKSGRGRVRKVLVVAEIAMAAVLLTGAGLLIRSLTNLLNIDVGFDPKNVLAISLDLPDQRYHPLERRAAFASQLMDGLRSIPGAASASLALAPLSPSTTTTACTRRAWSRLLAALTTRRSTPLTSVL